MKFSLPTRWILYTTLFSAPYLVLMTAGTFWLHDRGWLVTWLIINAVLMFALWEMNRRWRTRKVTAGDAATLVQPDPRWSPAGEAAWQDVSQIAAVHARPDLPLTDVAYLWGVVHEVLEVVARRFHPHAKHPVLEIPLPYVLRILELVAADLRIAFSAHVPGAHILTLRDFQRMKQIADWSTHLYDIYRLIRLGTNPVGALLGEAREAVGGRMTQESTAELKQWAASYVIQKTGYYAIQLYSGQVILSDVEFEKFHSQRARREQELSEQREAEFQAEPLRVLVLGQVKAGKSSLINGLFGATRAAVDVIPTTVGVEPYVLERDGFQRAIILDTAGFSVERGEEDPFDTLREQLIDCDLILVVCSATSASRGADQRLLERVRNFFRDEPTRVPPPLLAVLTHIDQLRPWQEWDPPYDLVAATTPKARNIAAAVEAVSKDLQLPTDKVIPVCLAEDRRYNLEDALIPAILQAMTGAQRTKYQRCLRQSYDEAYWRELWHQAANSGRLLRKAFLGV